MQAHFEESEKIYDKHLLELTNFCFREGITMDKFKHSYGFKQVEWSDQCISEVHVYMTEKHFDISNQIQNYFNDIINQTTKQDEVPF